MATLVEKTAAETFVPLKHVDFLVLLVLMEHDLHGYGIVKEIADRTRGQIRLEPGNLYLGKTIEYTESPIHVPMLEGRSSLARLGLWVHVTAGFGDKGFKGHWTLEIACIHPTRIYPGMEIAQLSWYDIDQDGLSYQDTGKYNNRRGSSPGASQSHKDFT